MIFKLEQNNQSEHVQEKNCEVGRNIVNWRVYFDLVYANQPIADMFNMQISRFFKSTRIIHQRVFRKFFVEIG